jgi:hypothetical protein
MLRTWTWQNIRVSLVDKQYVFNFPSGSAYKDHSFNVVKRGKPLIFSENSQRKSANDLAQLHCESSLKIVPWDIA